MGIDNRMIGRYRGIIAEKNHKEMDKSRLGLDAVEVQGHMCICEGNIKKNRGHCFAVCCGGFVILLCIRIL